MKFWKTVFGYQGSRQENARYMYPNTVYANFIELKAKYRLEPDEFFKLLERVQGVREVALHPQSKAEQNNPGAQDPKKKDTAPRALPGSYLHGFFRALSR